MDEMDLALASMFFLTLREKFVLRNNLDSLDKLALMSIDDISAQIQRPIKKALWDGSRAAALARKEMPVISAQKIGAVRADQDAYPPLLRQIPDAPYMLFFRGSLECLHKQCVSVVGTRRVCREAAMATADFCKSAANAGFTVVSGLAYGADSYAHNGALQSGQPGSTAAVLPCGIDAVVPGGNKSLAAKILRSGGALVSEYVPGFPGETWCFVQRNRIVAALSGATVITEAPGGSGALITADFALGYGRDVVLHKSCFCQKAAEQNSAGRQGPGAERKRRMTVESLMEEGAPVVEDFDGYMRAIENESGVQKGLRKGELF